MKLHQTWPMRIMNEVDRDNWHSLYVHADKPEGHKISSSTKNSKCYCATCKEWVNQYFKKLDRP